MITIRVLMNYSAILLHYTLTGIFNVGRAPLMGKGGGLRRVR